MGSRLNGIFISQRSKARDFKTSNQQNSISRMIFVAVGESDPRKDPRTYLVAREASQGFEGILH